MWLKESMWILSIGTGLGTIGVFRPSYPLQGAELRTCVLPLVLSMETELRTIRDFSLSSAAWVAMGNFWWFPPLLSVSLGDRVDDRWGSLPLRLLHRDGMGNCLKSLLLPSFPIFSIGPKLGLVIRFPSLCGDGIGDRWESGPLSSFLWKRNSGRFWSSPSRPLRVDGDSWWIPQACAHQSPCASIYLLYLLQIILWIPSFVLKIFEI